MKNILLRHLDADVHSIVAAEQRTQRAGIGIFVERGNTLHQCQQLVALNEQAQFAAREDHMGGIAGQTAQVGQFHGFIGSIERIVAIDGTTTNFGRISSVTVERESASGCTNAHLGELSVEVFFNFCGCNSSTGFSQEVFAFKNAIGTDVFPSALYAALRQRGTAFQYSAEQIAQQASRLGNR